MNRDETLVDGIRVLLQEYQRDERGPISTIEAIEKLVIAREKAMVLANLGDTGQPAEHNGEGLA